jgi:hypothetical protein
MSSWFRKMLVQLAITSMVVLSTASFADEVVLKGYLVDVACSARRIRKAGPPIVHSRMCMQMPACSESGYGLLTEDKQFIRFDEESNQKVKKLLSETSKENDFRITVTGSREGETIKISKIELQ